MWALQVVRDDIEGLCVGRRIYQTPKPDVGVNYFGLNVEPITHMYLIRGSTHCLVCPVKDSDRTLDRIKHLE